MSSSKAAPQAKRDITQWASADGRFRRSSSAFRAWITSDGQFPPEKNRYHLYLSLACPWAHRTLIYLRLKGLDSIIGISVVHPHMGQEGWSWSAPDEFSPNLAGVIQDPHYSATKLRDIYFKANPEYEGRFTVPVLFDTKHQTIVNNESSEIIRIFNSSFDCIIDEKYQNIDLYPSELREQIDLINEWVYDKVNNGVYKVGFATTQAAYEEALSPLFEALDRLEGILKDKQFLIGDRLTEADVRLYPTMIRFDVVYVQHFKCNIRTIRDGYPNIDRWLRNLYWNEPVFKETTNFEHIKFHYFTSHPQINPKRIIPKGPLPEIEKL